MIKKVIRRVNTNKKAETKIYISRSLVKLFGKKFFRDYPLGKVKENTNRTYKEGNAVIYCKYCYHRGVHQHVYVLTNGKNDDSTYSMHRICNL